MSLIVNNKLSYHNAAMLSVSIYFPADILKLAGQPSASWSGLCQFFQAGFGRCFCDSGFGHGKYYSKKLL